MIQPKSPRKLVFHIVLIVIVIVSNLVFLELAAQIIYKVKFKKWRYRISSANNDMFMAHPYLVGVPRPGVSITKINKKGKAIKISHNSLGFRGREIDLRKKDSIRRIVVLGGSTTYCIRVSDDETWPYYLEKKLGPGWEVINLGVPGYSTVENLIQTALQISELSPDIAIYYEGWNDIRDVHIKNLRPDYANFHGNSQAGNLNINSLKIGDQSASIFFIRSLLTHMFLRNDVEPIKPSSDAFSAKPDYRALSLYGRNLASIIVICKELNIIPIMVPQILNYQVLVSEKSYGWIPYLKDKDIKTEISFYNATMRKVALQEKSEFVNEVLEVPFHSRDFVDNGHFSRVGNEKFAAILANHILQQTGNLEKPSGDLR